MPNTIFYFSGTGNSLWLAQNAAGQLGDTEVLSVMALKDNPQIPAKYERVGFVYILSSGIARRENTLFIAPDLAPAQTGLAP